MKRFSAKAWLAILLLGCLGGVAVAQSDATAWVINQVLFDSRAYELLRELSDDIGRRLSTTSAAERAVTWAEEQFRRAGAANIRREPFSMLGWESEALLAEVTETRRPIQMLAYAATPSLETAAAVMDLGEGTEQEFSRQVGKLKGKVLLVGSGQPPRNLEEYLSAYLAVPGIVERARKEQAAAVLLVHFQPGQVLYQTVALSGKMTPLPVFRVTREDGLWLRRRVASGQPTTLRIRSLNRIREAATSWNVVAEIPGTEKPEEIVLVGAHLDSIGPGAGTLDDGAGVAALLDLARILRLQPAKRTVRFALFTGEEEGLLGSFAYVQQHRDELDRIVAMVQMDTGAGRVVAYENTGRPDVAARLEKLVAKFGPLGPREVRPGQSWYSDHGPFVLAGIPAFFLMQETSEYEPYIHTQADTFDKVNPDDYRAAQAVLAATVVEIANLSERFARRWSKQEMRDLLERTGEVKVLRELGISPWPLD